MNRILVLILLTLTVSCEKEQALKNAYEVSFPEDIQEVIRQFAEKQKLDKNSAFLDVFLSGNSAQQVFHLSYSETHLDEIVRLPMHYSIVDDRLVFVYSDIDYLNIQIENEQKREFYNGLIEERNIILEKSETISHNDVWQVIKCTNDIELIVNYISSPNIYELPCGYYMTRHGIPMDSLSLNWYSE